MVNPKFNRLLRFVSTSGNIHLGEVPDSHPWNKDLVGTEVSIYNGTSPFDENLQLSNEKAVVKKVLCPLADVSFIYGVGLNYRKHAEESGVSTPPCGIFQTPITLRSSQQYDFTRMPFPSIQKRSSSIPVCLSM